MVYLKKIFLAAVFVGLGSSIFAMHQNTSSTPVDIDLGEMYIDWVCCGNLEGIRILIKYGFDVNSKIERMDCGGEMVTLLHVAAECGKIRIARVLLAAGAEIDSPIINLTAKMKQTLLYAAVLNGCLEKVQILLDAGADWETKIGSLTVLEIAKNNGFIAIAKALIDEKEIKTRKRAHGMRWFRCDCDGDCAGHGKGPESKRPRIDRK